MLQSSLIDLVEQNAKISKALARALRYGFSFNTSLKETTTEELVKAISDFNTLVDTKLFKEMPRPPIGYMTEVVLDWFNTSSEREKEEFITTKFDNLNVFFSTLGISIINHFSLWSYPWEKQLKDGADTSPNHPENLAMLVIENVWRTVKDDA